MVIVNHPLPAANEMPETHMAFSFAWLTSDKKYSFKGLHKVNDPTQTALQFGWGLKTRLKTPLFKLID